MRFALFAALILMTTSARAFADADVGEKKDVIASDPSGAHDGLLVSSSALPSAGTFRAQTSGGGGASLAPGGGISALFAFTPGFALTGGVRTFGGRVGPDVGVRVQLANQADHGVNVVASSAVHAPGMMEDAGAEAEARLAVGRRFGRLGVATNAAIGQGLGARRDVDFEGAASVTVAASDRLHVGVEGRLRAELEDRDLPNVGRAWEGLLGPTAYVAIAQWRIGALGGVGVPRGLAHAGPAGLLSASIDF